MLLRGRTRRGNADHARTLLRIAAQGYRATKMLDIVPVALGLWAEAERRCGQAERARELGREAVRMMEDGSPSTLNEAPVFLALHDAAVDLGALQEGEGRAIALAVHSCASLHAGPAGW